MNYNEILSQARINARSSKVMKSYVALNIQHLVSVIERDSFHKKGQCNEHAEHYLFLIGCIINDELPANFLTYLQSLKTKCEENFVTYEDIKPITQKMHIELVKYVTQNY